MRAGFRSLAPARQLISETRASLQVDVEIREGTVHSVLDFIHQADELLTVRRPVVPARRCET